MLEIIILSIILAYALTGKIERVLILLTTILPFHFLIKSFFNFFIGSSSIFSIWKELVILILFLRVLILYLKNDKNPFCNYPILLISLFYISELILFVFAPNTNEALTSLKTYCFPFIVLFVSQKTPLSDSFYKNFVNAVTFTAISVCLVGYLQRYFFNIPFAFLMNMGDNISESGTMIYKNSANLIMGLERMYGPFPGPNEFGLYIATVFLFLLTVFFTTKTSKWERIFFMFALLLCTTVLIQSFSRISWAIVFVYMSFTFYKKLLNKQVLIGISFILLIGVFFFLYTDFGDVLLSSIKLKEASAEARPDSFFSGINMLVNNPLGLGLGTVQYFSEHRLWETEIFWWMVFLENGIFIGLLYAIIYIHHIIFLFREKKIFTEFNAKYLVIVALSGFASIIIFEPIFLVYLWLLVGLSLNKKFNITFNK